MEWIGGRLVVKTWVWMRMSGWRRRVLMLCLSVGSVEGRIVVIEVEAWTGQPHGVAVEDCAMGGIVRQRSLAKTICMLSEEATRNLPPKREA